MQVTQLGAVAIGLGPLLAFVVLALVVRHRTRGSRCRSEDIWEAGATADPPHSRSKETVTWVAVGSVGCGGCGGCGCGG